MKRGLVLSLLAICASGAAAPRTPWTTSTIRGSPDAPPAFEGESYLSKLKFVEAVELATVPGSQQLIAVERRGQFVSFALESDIVSATPLLDLRGLHSRIQNAYGVVLHPRFRENRQIFVCYVLGPGDDGSRVSRFTLSSLEPLIADPASEEVILTWRGGGHNGCNLQFGPDGYLYITTGDSGGGSPPDLHATGQDTSDLSASILRIDIDARDPGKLYRVPPDNPWTTATVGARDPARAPAIRPELWAYGLRNPWKMSFDRATGRLWCGDIGWEMWEMVHLITRGGNYGWSAYEANQPIKTERANLLSPITQPIVAHPHTEAYSITGGFVYRGKRLPELAGAYIYGDFVTGKIWALWYDADHIVRHEEIADTPHAIVSFGEADDGELYYLHYGANTTLHRLARNSQVAEASSFPRTLSATGLFADVERQQPAPGVYPFSVTTPLWEDGASATRFIALPGESVVTTNIIKDGSRTKTSLNWPQHAVLARTLSLGQLALSPEDRAKPVETQVLYYDGRYWNPYTYRWNEAGTDAELVPSTGAEMTIRTTADPNSLGKSRDYTWRFQSRAECLRCHNDRTSIALAFHPLQLGGSGNKQVAEFIQSGILDAKFLDYERLVHGSLQGNDAAARVRLHVNCAHCHTIRAGGSVPLFLGYDLPTAKMNTVNVAPSQGTFGVTHPLIVSPGDPGSSVLAIRMAKTGSGHMPLIGGRDVDIEGLKVIEDWIAGMPGSSALDGNATQYDRATIERELATVEGAMRLRRAIDDGKLDSDLRLAAFTAAWASSDSVVRDLYERFKPDELRERTLGIDIDQAAILKLKGDPMRGARLMASEGRLASCLACHLVQGRGRHFGPDLSRIGSRKNASQILESLVAPSKVIDPLYRTTIITLQDGSSHAGFVRARGVKEILLTEASGQSVRINLPNVAKEETLLTSLMPEGQLQGLTAQEAADVVEYLAGLN